jgi:polyferredoxin
VKKSIFTSLSLAMAMLLLLSTFVIAANLSSPGRLWAGAIWALTLAGFTFLIYRTGKVSRYRRLFFVIYAVSFVLVFISRLIEARGSMALTSDVIARREAPLCPVALPQLLLPAVLKGTLIFPTKLVGGPYGGFYPILFLWFVSVVTLGRGWCSWGCFFGGIDDGFAAILKKPSINPAWIRKWRLFPFAVLMFAVLLAFATMQPVYCTWLCPLKVVTEYGAVTNTVRLVQAVIFVTLGVGLLFLLPLLTKKRAQCGIFCPLGALQSLVGVVSPYRVRIERNKCNGCRICRRSCPALSIGNEPSGRPSIELTCTRCGQCMDTCPQKAIDFAFIGSGCFSEGRSLTSRFLGDDPSRLKRIALGPLRFLEEMLEARTFFVFTAIFFGATLSGSFVPDALVRLYHLGTAGTLLIK